MRSHGTNKRFHYVKQDHSKLLCCTILISYSDIELEIFVSNRPPWFQQPSVFMLLIVLAAIVVMKFIDDRNCYDLDYT